MLWEHTGRGPSPSWKVREVFPEYALSKLTLKNKKEFSEQGSVCKGRRSGLEKVRLADKNSQE